MSELGLPLFPLPPPPEYATIRVLIENRRPRVSATEDQSLARIRRIAETYRGAEWALNYESAEAAWSMRITPPAGEPDDQDGDTPGTTFRLFRSERAPVFAMRCDELEVIAEALEHWHARVLMRLPSQPNE